MRNITKRRLIRDCVNLVFFLLILYTGPWWMLPVALVHTLWTFYDGTTLSEVKESDF